MPKIKRDWPDIETDLMIIANWRMAVIKQLLVLEQGESATQIRFFDIAPFACETRVYITNNSTVIAVLPFDAYDEITLITDALLTHIENPPLEVWVLKDDQVIQNWEEPEPDHS